MMINGTGMTIDLAVEVGQQVLASPIFYFLIGAILLDFATGMGKAFLTGTYSSKIGIDGVVKHSMVLLLAIFVSFFFRLFGIAPVGSIIKIILGFNYVISIVENMESAGVLIPDSIKNLFLQMRNDAENKLMDEDVNIRISKLPVDPRIDKTKKGVDR